MRRKVAFSAIGPSALRGQGEGVSGISQEFLSDLSLKRIPRSSQWRVKAWLDRQTELLLNRYRIKNRPWGAARKALNHFLRGVAPDARASYP